jgi:transposase-like protein
MKRRSEEEKAMWLEDWKQSGRSVSAYAKANGLNPQTFNNWVKEAEKPAQQNFIEINPAPDKTSPYVPEILIEKGNIRIHIPILINRSDLKAIVESLGCEL